MPTPPIPPCIYTTNPSPRCEHTSSTAHDLDGLRYDIAGVVHDAEHMVDRLHEIKRTVDPGDARDSILLALDRVQAVWAAAVLARTTLRDVTL